MRFIKLLTTAFVFALATSVTQAQTAPSLVLNLGPAGFNCGRMSTPTYCWGIPVAAADDDGITNGSIWIDQSSNGGGFILFLSNFEGLGQAQIVNTPFQPLSTQGGSLTYTFAGNDGETGKPYSGVLKLTYTTYYSAGGGGRGGAAAGWRYIVNGGSISVTE
ncbi:hypothetical protein DYQ86_16250 [Acidobacteria bacterium AB60]|nr:hypothetical protein DYQ86_16250 [Acidobacteria bacterium AB60]